MHGPVDEAARAKAGWDQLRWNPRFSFLSQTDAPSLTDLTAEPLTPGKAKNRKGQHGSAPD